MRLIAFVQDLRICGFEPKSGLLLFASANLSPPLSIRLSRHLDALAPSESLIDSPHLGISKSESLSAACLTIRCLASGIQEPQDFGVHQNRRFSLYRVGRRSFSSRHCSMNFSHLWGLWMSGTGSLQSFAKGIEVLLKTLPYKRLYCLYKRFCTADTACTNAIT